MKQLLDILDKKEITKVKFFLIDMEGHLKFMIIPRNSVEESVDGIGIDGSSISGFTTVDRSDLLAVPDEESGVILEHEAAVFCDVVYEDGHPFEGDPRSIVKNVLKKGNVYVKPELEFYLLKERAPLDCKGYMDPAEGLALVEAACNSVNIPVERIHHENGPGQYEIEPVMAPALQACDNIILLKELLRQKAGETGITATFMPKPLYGEAGSGMHVHMLLEKDGKNLFENLTNTARYFVGGLLSHARGFTAVCNPTINSYKRLVPHFEAPVHITWGIGNRSTLVRIPRGGRTRIEYRAPDPSCNPYLALAVILGAGFHGIETQAEPPQKVTENVFESHTQAETLPATLQEAVEEMVTDDLVREILGEYVVEKFVALKKGEIQKYRTHISQWELDHYLEW